MSQPQEKPPAFDAYANNYVALSHHPFLDRFASGRRFFVERKMEIIQAFFRRDGVKTETLDWLDVGCGHGDLLRMGRPHFRSTAGCDPSNGMLQFCQDLTVRHQSSADSLPFEDAAFDFITAVGVYHHVGADSRVALTAEVSRVLRPGGVFCVIEHNPQNPITRFIVSRTPIDAGVELLTAKETGRLLSAAGCKVLETQFFLLFPEGIHRYTRPVEDALAAFPFGGQYAIFSRSRV
jgi:ubiquinone/menaquinone biosynthesis C-methylase UbiE